MLQQQVKVARAEVVARDHELAQLRGHDWVVALERQKARLAATEAQLVRYEASWVEAPTVAALLERLERGPERWTALRTQLELAHAQIDVLSAQLEATQAAMQGHGQPGSNALLAELQAQVATLSAENEALAQSASFAAASRNSIQHLHDKLAQLEADGAVETVTEQAQTIAELRARTAFLEAENAALRGRKQPKFDARAFQAWRASQARPVGASGDGRA